MIDGSCQSWIMIFQLNLVVFYDLKISILLFISRRAHLSTTVGSLACPSNNKVNKVMKTWYTASSQVLKTRSVSDHVAQMNAVRNKNHTYLSMSIPAFFLGTCCCLLGLPTSAEPFLGAAANSVDSSMASVTTESSMASRGSFDDLTTTRCVTLLQDSTRRTLNKPHSDSGT